MFYRTKVIVIVKLVSSCQCRMGVRQPIKLKDKSPIVRVALPTALLTGTLSLGTSLCPAGSSSSPP